jgi:PA14 domain
MIGNIFSRVMREARATVILVAHTLVLGSTMRRSALMRHSIVFSVAALVALVAVGGLYPIRIADAADAATSVEAEDFVRPTTGISLVTNTTLYSGGRALKFSNNTAIAKKSVDFTSSGDVVLWARATQSGGSPKLRVSVNGTFTAPAKAITNSGAPKAYTFDVNAPSGPGVQIGVKASNTATGRYPFLDRVTFPPNGACAKGTFDAEYRNEVKNFATAPVIDRCENAPINYAWGTGSPGAGVNADNFTSRYVGTFDFEAGNYKFDVTTDDGVRLYVDGVLLLDHWYANEERMFATKTMTAGEHQIKVEHFEGGGAATLAVAWAKQAEPVMAADDFVGRIGVNTHFAFTWAPDYDNYTAIVQRMKDANIRLAREHVYYEPGHPNDEERLMIYRHMVDNGIRIMCIADDRFEGMNPITPAKIDYINTQSNNACAFFEGQNEPDLKDGWMTSEIVSSQQALFNAVNGSQRPEVPVLGPSIYSTDGARTIRTAFNAYTDMGANVHPYHQDYRPSFGLPDMQARLDAQRAMTPGKKLVSTEEGWDTCPSNCARPISVSENVQSKYTLRVLFWSLFDADFERIVLYEMIDEASRASSNWTNGAYYGLLRSDLTPKPAYTSLKRLTSLLAEPNASPFTPQGLSYSLSGSIANVRSYLLQKSNGTHYLVLYQDVSSWDAGADTGISNPNKSVTVNLGSPASRVLVHSPHSSATPVADNAGPVSSVSVSVPDHPLVLEIRH